MLFEINFACSDIWWLQDSLFNRFGASYRLVTLEDGRWFYNFFINLESFDQLEKLITNIKTVLNESEDSKNRLIEVIISYKYKHICFKIL